MSDEDRITEIINKLEDLSIETTRLTQELRTLTQRPARRPAQRPFVPPPQLPTNEHDYKAGDKVEITNNYQWKKGTKGIVTRVSYTQVTLRDDKGAFHTRKHTNIVRVKEEKK